MEQNKLIALINRIITKTSYGELDWESTNNPKSFSVSLSNYSISISAIKSFDYDDDDYRITIYNEEGDVIEEATDIELKNQMPDALIRFKTLFDEARRKAMGVDEALDDILKELEDDEDAPF